MGIEEQIKTIERTLNNPTIANNPNLKGGLEKKLDILKKRLAEEEKTGVKYDTLEPIEPPTSTPKPTPKPKKKTG
jgi:hypothetical protein